MESILTSIKKLLGISEEDTNFDVDIIMHINSVFSILRRIGVGPVASFKIDDKFANWEDFLGEDATHLEDVKTYMYLRVKLIFDPPLNSSVTESIKSLINELEWQLANKEPEAQLEEE